MGKIKNTEWTFIKEVDPLIRKNGTKRRKGIFRCSCGREYIRDMYIIKGFGSKRCSVCSPVFVGNKNKKHGLMSHPLYRKWSDMKKRCYNENVERYKSYGGKGISVCAEWKDSFKNFYDWCIDNGWCKGLTIDRINVYKDYSPENCRFLTKTEQSFNKRNTFFVEISDTHKASLAEIMYRNGKSYYYRTVWHGVKKIGKDLSFYIKKHNLSLDYDFTSKKRI